ncbi:MAG: hypothetical protein PF572_04180 [Patescibacteria group bacterium]|jgi:hypothetical protein|nr:hypothetical protein [Patescibacteria group bacterium]
MLSFTDFKNELGEAGQYMSDKQIDELRILHDQLADVLFEIWIEKKNSNLN